MPVVHDHTTPTSRGEEAGSTKTSNDDRDGEGW